MLVTELGVKLGRKLAYRETAYYFEIFFFLLKVVPAFTEVYCEDPGCNR